MRLAMRSADRPGPGKRFGHDVTMRQRRVSARATAGAATAPRSESAPPRASLRRVMSVIGLPCPPHFEEAKTPASYLIACGLSGEPVPPVMISGEPQKKNS